MTRMMKYLSLLAAFTLMLGLAGCSDDDSGGACGNGIAEAAEGEECDGDDLANETCSTLGYNPGTLGCTSDCTFDFANCGSQIVCGNDVQEGSEECDGPDLNNETCITQGCTGGTLGCVAAGQTDECTFDLSSCTNCGVCGNGQIDGTEDCDGGFLGGATCVTEGYYGGDLGCNSDCTFDYSDCYNQPTFPVGEPCTDHDDCPGGFCRPEANDSKAGPPGGYCMEYCDENDNCPGSGPNGVCVPFTGGVNYCLKACDPQGSDCRDGYRCEQTSVGDFCYWGYCTDNAQCVVTGDCDTDSGTETQGLCISPDENCSDGQDNDFDGRVDCNDPECNGQTACPLGETCGNNQDDDSDGYTDCDDGECSQLGLCSGEVCTPAGTLSCGDSLTGENNAQTGSTNVIEGADCVDPEDGRGIYFRDEWGPEYAYTLTVTQPQLVTITISNYSGDLDIYIIKQTNNICDAYLGCFEYGGEGVGVDEVMTFAAYPGITYYVVVDGFHGNVSDYDVDVVCASTGFEVCSGGTDEDNDGMTDCEDPECWGVGACSTEVSCNNRLDDDLDGAIDCYDSDCAAAAECQPGKGYWEMWERNGGQEFDLVGDVLEFTADASNTQGYTWAITSTGATAFPDTPGSGTATHITLGLEDSDNSEQILPFTFNFEGVDYGTMYITDNGFISFHNEIGFMPGPGGWNLYEFPRIGPLWTDLDPTQGGSIYYDVYADRVTITWQNMYNNYTGQNPNSAQLTLFSNGNIRMAWLAVDSVNNLPSWVAGYVTLVGANLGTPPAETNFQ